MAPSMRELRAGRLERERPVVARRSPEELIGYDEIGLPGR